MQRLPILLALFLIVAGLGGLGLSINCLYSLRKGDDTYDAASRRIMAGSQLLGVAGGMLIAVAAGIAVLKLIGY
jgi:hypothetical protein